MEIYPCCSCAELRQGARSMPPSNRSTGALSSSSTNFSSHPFVAVHRVVVDTVDSATLGLQGRFGQGVNVAVLDCEGHELHALCGAMTLLMQVSAAAASVVSSSYVTFAAAAGRAKVCKFLLQSSRPTSCAGHHSAFALFSSSALTSGVLHYPLAAHSCNAVYWA